MTIFVLFLGAGCFSLVLVGVLLVWLVRKVAQQPKPEPRDAWSSGPASAADASAGAPGASEGASTATPDSAPPVDRDEWEGSFWEVQQPVPVRARLRLRYVDGAGSKTDRSVEVRQFGGLDGTTLLIGRCLLRNATRTFRTDRILECVDEETGEVISDVRSYLTRKYQGSPERSRDALLEGEYDTLRILLYVGKADGQLRAAEKAIIRDACVAIAKDSRLTPESIGELLASMQVPTLHAFKMAVGRLASRDQSSRSLVLDASRRIVGTQKTIKPAEQEALEYMREQFGTAG